MYTLNIEYCTASPPQRPSFNDPSFDTTGTTATIRWTISTAGNSQPAANYQVICSSVNAPHNITPLVSSNNIVLHGLNPCASYTCCIGGIDTNGAIGAVDCISFQTPFSPIVGRYDFVVVISLICIQYILYIVLVSYV